MSGRLKGPLLLALALPAGAGESLTPTLDWPEISALPVSHYLRYDFLSSANQHGTRINVHADLDIQHTDDGYRLVSRVRDFNFTLEPDDQVGGDIQRLIIELALEQPVLLLDETGQLIGSEDFPAFRARLLTRLDNALSALDQRTAMPDLAEHFSAEERLERFVKPAIKSAIRATLDGKLTHQRAAEAQYRQTSVWHGRQLQVDEPQQLRRQRRLPLFSDRTIDFLDSLVLLGNAPCDDRKAAPTCVRLRLTSQPDDGAVQAFLASEHAGQVTIADVTLSGRVVALRHDLDMTLLVEPAGLIIHEIRWQEENTAILLGADGRETPIRELHQGRTRFHWPTP